MVTKDKQPVKRKMKRKYVDGNGEEHYLDVIEVDLTKGSLEDLVEFAIEAEEDDKNIEKMQKLPFAICIFSAFALSAVLGVFSLIMLSYILYKKEKDWVVLISDASSTIFEVLIMIALLSISISGFVYLLCKSGVISC